MRAGVQQAADLAARELAETPLPATDTFAQALQDPGVQQRIFDERYLVLTIDSNPAGSAATYNNGHPIGDFPVVIQQLIPMMIYDQLVVPNSYAPDRRVALSGRGLHRPQPRSCANPPASGYLVRIPILTYPPAPRCEHWTTVGWVPVLEEIPSSSTSSSFPVNSAQQGLVALRLNYPYQWPA